MTAKWPAVIGLPCAGRWTFAILEPCRMPIDQTDLGKDSSTEDLPNQVPTAGPLCNHGGDPCRGHSTVQCAVCSVHRLSASTLASYNLRLPLLFYRSMLDTVPWNSFVSTVPSHPVSTTGCKSEDRHGHEPWYHQDVLCVQPPSTLPEHRRKFGILEWSGESFESCRHEPPAHHRSGQTKRSLAREYY